MHIRIDPDTVVPATILFGMGVLCLSIGIDTLRNGTQSKLTMRQIALGLDRQMLAYNPETKTILCGTLPETEY